MNQKKKCHHLKQQQKILKKEGHPLKDCRFPMIQKILWIIVILSTLTWGQILGFRSGKNISYLILNIGFSLFSLYWAMVVTY